MLREAAFDHLAEFVVLFAAQETQPTDSPASVTNQPSRIVRRLVVVDAFAVSKRDEGLVAVCCGCCFALRPKPAFELLGGDLCDRP